MKLLLEITSTPTKYELEIEHARLEYQSDFTPNVNISSEPTRLKIHTKDTSVRIDTYESRKSLGLYNSADQAQAAAEKGKAAIAEATRNYVEIGRQMAKIENGTTIPQIMNQKMLEQPQLYTAFLPKGGARLSWEPPEINVNVEKGNLELDWENVKNSMNYIPGYARIKIIERASIDIKYIGDPIYVPPSASPTYEDPLK